MLAKMSAWNEKQGETAPPLASVLTNFLPLVAVDVRTRAQLECAAAAVAVERFRMRKGRWPDSLEEVVAAKLLDKMPLDVCDGKPLGYRKMPDGVVVSANAPAGEPCEFRLWDENKRRQPPLPEKKLEK
jgi:hypothetical protein